MGSVNISIKEDAYRFLKSLKSGNKSFSDVILEFKDKKGSKEAVLRFVGVLKDKKDWDLMEKNMGEFREEFEERTDRIAKYMEEARKEVKRKNDRA